MIRLAYIFPTLFFIVSTMVCLTTMTRMVEEERMQIGTLKALGYGKVAIASKYLLYSATASVIGSIIGVFVGELSIPPLIITAYRAICRLNTNAFTSTIRAFMAKVFV